MKRIWLKIGLLLVFLVASIFVNLFSFSNAIDNISKHVKTLNQYKVVTEKMEKTVDETSKVRKDLQTARGNSSVDIEDADAIYKAVTSIDGVTENSAVLLRIGSGEPAKIRDYDPSNKQATLGADGISITVVVRDVDFFLQKFQELKVPYFKISVVHPDTITLFFNTKGGQA